MQIKRVSNAGILVALGGDILLPGPASGLFSLPGAASSAFGRAGNHPPDMLAYTHSHPDHFEPSFATRFYEKPRRPVLGTASVVEMLPGIPVER